MTEKNNRRAIPELKDKNGTQIYEGDILEEEGYERIQPLGHKRYYKMDNKLYTSCGCCAVIYGWDLGGDPETSVVIGNVYDNPELLEKLK